MQRLHWRKSIFTQKPTEINFKKSKLTKEDLMQLGA